MAKMLLTYIIFCLLLVACKAPAPNQAAIDEYVKGTIEAWPTQTALPTYTPFPTATKVRPTSTIVPTPTISSNPFGIVGVAKNSLGMQEKKNVQLEIYRMIIADRSTYNFANWSNTSSFDDAKSMIELIVKYTNNTGELIKFHSFSEGIAAINGEQINFRNFFYETRFDDNSFSGLLPGMSITTGFWFPVKNSEWQDIKEIKLYIPGAINKDNYTFTDEFEFTIIVENWGFEAKQP